MSEDPRIPESDASTLQAPLSTLQTANERELTDFEKKVEERLLTYQPGSDEEKRLVRKLDLYLIPALWFMYILAYIDRQNIGNAKIAGMGDDLGLTDSQYANALGIFFVGYLIFEIPSNLILAKTRPSVYLTSLLAVWGTISAFMSQIHSYESLLVTRFFLGFVEAGFFPGVVFIMSSWYRKEEAGKRFSLFYTAVTVSGALSGILSGAITGSLEGARGIRGWRWLFIIEGSMTVLFALGSAFILIDYPENNRVLGDEEKVLAVVRMIQDRNTTARRHTARLTHWQALKAALAEPRTYLFTFIYAMVVSSATVQYFLPTMIKNMGYDAVRAQYMTIPIYAVSLVAIVGWSYSSDRARERRWHSTISLALSAALAFVCLFVYGDEARYVLLCFFMACLYMTVPLVLNWTSETISLPPEKRAVVVAIVNSVSNLSSVYGSHLWPSAHSPKFIMGFACVTAFTGAAALAAAMLPIIFRYLPQEGRTRAERAILQREREDFAAMAKSNPLTTAHANSSTDSVNSCTGLLENHD